MPEHTILVAITVEADTREDAQRALMRTIKAPSEMFPNNGITSWWVAEDDRTDRSDCDSAIFVPRGSQDDMRHVLDNYFEAHREEWQEDGYPYADTDVSGVWFRED